MSEGLTDGAKNHIRKWVEEDEGRQVLATLKANRIIKNSQEELLKIKGLDSDNDKRATYEEVTDWLGKLPKGRRADVEIFLADADDSGNLSASEIRGLSQPKPRGR